MASLRNKRAASLLLLLATASMVSASAASSDVAAAAERGAVKVAKKQSARRQVLRGHQSQQDRRAQQDGSSSTATSSVNPVRLFRAGPLKKPPPPGGSLPSPGSATALTDFITPRKHKKKCGKTKKGYKKNICDVEGDLLQDQTTYYPTISPSSFNPTVWMDDDAFLGNWNIDPDTGDVIDAHSKADSDGDGLLDGKENQIGTDPNNPDSDGDGLSDSQEVFLGTDPLEVDTDGDGVSDYEEVVKGSDPMDGGSTPDVLDEVDDLSDSDGDGLSDYDEIIYHGTLIDCCVCDGVLVAKLSWLAEGNSCWSSKYFCHWTLLLSTNSVFVLTHLILPPQEPTQATRTRTATESKTEPK